MDVSTTDKGVFGFGPFRLDPTRRQLLRDGTAIKLPSKQFDTLLYLVENAGRVIEKDELFAAVWGERIIEEGSLTQTIFLLRRALQAEAGEAYIVTAPGRGYRFVAAISRIAAGSSSAEDLQSAAEPASVFGQTTSPGQLACEDVSDASSDVTGRRGRAHAMRLKPRRWVYVVAGVVALAVAATIWLGRRPGSPDAEPFNPPPRSVAVLAFTNLSGDARQDYFSDGLSDELINTLGRNRALQVAARMSAFTFKGTQATVGDIARKLNVGAVLEGSVRRDGDRLRVTVQLINAVTGFQFWSRNFDRSSHETLALQADIADAVAGSLEVTMMGGQAARHVASGTTDPQAFDAYLRGIDLMRLVDGEAVRTALRDFEDAIRIDPNFADAHAGRAYALHSLGWAWPADPRPWQEEQAEALSEADKAVQLDPNSARAHAIRGSILQWRRNVIEANEEVLKAYELDDNDVVVVQIYTRMEAMLGHCAEAEAAGRRLVALDPLTADQYHRLAAALILCRKFNDGLAVLQQEEARGSKYPERIQYLRAFAHLGLGRPDAAVQDCVSKCDGMGLEILAIAEMKIGHADKAHAALAKFRSESGDLEAATFFADVYAQWGDAKSALYWLDFAFKSDQGKMVKLSDYRGKTVVLTMFATW